VTIRFQRNVAIAELSDDIFDVLVIGGGITGAGVLLDAASRGLKAALVEKKDFASGTSSKSSKLIHGGLRYLQQKDFSLVYEALLERQNLLRNAPHLVSPLKFIIPLYGNSEALIKALSRFYNIALWTYDLTGGIRIGKVHRKISKKEAVAFIPDLKEDNLHAAFLYWDAQADDARLTLSLLRTAVEIHGATALNYCEVKDITKDADTFITTCELPNNSSIEIKSKALVNAAGVHSDEIRALDEKQHPRSIIPAKGIHLVVKSRDFKTNVAGVIPAPKDKRSIFVIPWYDYTYIGTTDTLYEGSLDDPPITKQDMEYLLTAINRFSKTELNPRHLTGYWSGLRPLLANSHNSLNSKTQDMSRRHTVMVSQNKMVTITGGKLTTYRKMAKDAVDKVVEILDLKHLRCKTRHLPLIGYEKPFVKDYFSQRYGSEKDIVLQIANKDPNNKQPVFEHLPYIYAEAEFSIKYEMVLTLDDLVSRRMRALILNLKATVDGVKNLRDLFQKYNLLNNEQFDFQLQALKQQLDFFNNIKS